MTPPAVRVSKLDRFLKLLQLLMKVRGFEPKRIRVEDYEIAYHEAGGEHGRGRRLLLIHGLGNSSSVWFKVVSRLVREHHVYAIDLPGFGQSPPPQGMLHSTIPDLQRAVTRFIEAVGGGPFVVVGQSLGGWIAAKVAADRPDLVEQLVLVNNAGIYYPQVEEIKEIMAVETREEVYSFWRRLWYRIPLLNWLFIRDYIQRMEQPRVVGFLNSVSAADFLNEDLRRIKAPVTILWGSQDRFIPRRSVNLMLRELGSVRVYWIPECGHIPQVERPRLFSRILDAHLRRPPTA